MKQKLRLKKKKKVKGKRWKVKICDNCGYQDPSLESDICPNCDESYLNFPMFVVFNITFPS